ncbi:MAG: hypothetical protein AAF639_34620, partial [Chloroflexota bacterium]
MFSIISIFAMPSTAAAMTPSELTLALTDFDCTSVTIPEAQCGTLTGLYTSTNGSNWSTKTDWFVTDSCNWHGVSCHSGNVVALAFNSNNLHGPITPKINDLPTLQALDLWKNKITSIPAEIGELSNLGFLNLGANQLVTLPVSLTNMPTLTTPNFNIAYNAIEVADPTLVQFPASILNIYPPRKKKLTLPGPSTNKIT